MRRAPCIELSAEEHTALQRTAPLDSFERSCARCSSAHRATGRRGQAEPQHRRAVGHPARTRCRNGGAASPRSAWPVSLTARGEDENLTTGENSSNASSMTTVHRTPEQATHWSTRTMARHAGVSHTTVQRIWHAHELKPHLVRTFKLSNDKQFVEKLRDVIGLYLNPPEHALVFCVDEKSQIQALDRSQPGLPIEEGTRRYDDARLQAPRHHHLVRPPSTVLEGTVIGKCYSRHRHTEYLRFLREIDRLTPKDLDIHLIVDNYSTHKHRDVKRWFERHPRFHHAHFSPDFFVMAQPGGAVLPRDHRTSNPARYFPKRTRTDSSHLQLSQSLQREPQALRMDQDRGPDSQQTRSPLRQSGIIGLNCDPLH